MSIDYVPPPPTDLICQLQPDILLDDDMETAARGDAAPPETLTTSTATTTSTTLPHLYVSKHIYYVMKLVTDLSQASSYEGAVTEHLRMSGIYWSLTTLHLLLPSTTHVNAIMNVTDTNTTLKSVDNSSSNIHSDTRTESTTTENEAVNHPEDKSTDTILDWIWTCYDATTGSFGGNTGQDGHILYTLSALQIIIISTTTIVPEISSSSSSSSSPPMDTRLHDHRNEIIRFIQQLQQPDGSFVGDVNECGEIDTRFTYCAFQSLVLLKAFTNDVINIPLAVQYILRCRNLSDGGFGSCIGAESHAGQVFCCIGALAIAQALDQLYPATNCTNDDLDVVDDDNDDDEPPDDVLGWWLCERQVDSGGLNGRPEKQADVCYSWWILSSLSILGKVSWINTNKLANYILKCQDTVDGGIADRPDDMADVFHTFFGIAGLSLLGHLHRADQVVVDTGTGSNNSIDHSATTSTMLTNTPSSSTNRIPFRSIDPIYALPTDICQQLKLPGQVMVARHRVTNENDSTTTAPMIDARLQHYNVWYYS